MAEMADTHRVEFTAREARDLVVQLKQECYKYQMLDSLLKLARITLVGHQFGAHIAACASKYLRARYEDTYTYLKGIRNNMNVLNIIFKKNHFFNQ